MHETPPITKPRLAFRNAFALANNRRRFSQEFFIIAQIIANVNRERNNGRSVNNIDGSICEA